MLYLKTAELTTYVTRQSVPSGQELAVIRAASNLIDAYCKRSLSIKYYKLDFELNKSGVGFAPLVPVISISPADYSTGFRIRPMRKTWGGSRDTVGEWTDVDVPNDIEELLNLRTGRIEIISSQDTDFGRFEYANRIGSFSDVDAYQAALEVKVGHLVDTKLVSSASNGAVSITVQDSTGITPNVTYLTKGDEVNEYLVTAKVGNVLTISPGLASSGSVNQTITQVVPDEVKSACGAVIEDRLTYQSNTHRQIEKLSILTDELWRVDKRPLPADARSLLAKYRNRR
jgi:hypothetical protein